MGDFPQCKGASSSFPPAVDRFSARRRLFVNFAVLVPWTDSPLARVEFHRTQCFRRPRAGGPRGRTHACACPVVLWERARRGLLRRVSACGEEKKSLSKFRGLGTYVHVLQK